MNRNLPTDVVALERMLDIIENDILPMTEAGVRAGDKIFGAAIVRKSDRSLVVAATNNETENPLWHGEVVALRRLYELLPPSTRPRPKDCLFLATHEPCSLCLSAITWCGFDNFYYLFSHEDSRDRFDIPHDVNILKEVFALEPGAYNADNAYWTSFAIATLVSTLADADAGRLRTRIESIADRYGELSRQYQQKKPQSAIPLP